LREKNTWGQGGSPKFVSTPNLIFVKPHRKFQNPTITTSGTKVTGVERPFIRQYQESNFKSDFADISENKYLQYGVY
jgi:hypothetical protein